MAINNDMYIYASTGLTSMHIMYPSMYGGGYSVTATAEGLYCVERERQ